MKHLIFLSAVIWTPLLLATPTRRSKEQVLHDLNSAVEAADGQAVFELTDELRALVPVHNVADAAGQGARHAARSLEKQKFLRVAATPRKQAELRKNAVLVRPVVPSAVVEKRHLAPNASTGFLLRRDRGLEPIPTGVKTLTVTLKPGRIGVFADWKSGKIADVEHDAQSYPLGIKKGMFFKEIDGEPYTEALLERKGAGKLEYKVTFAIPWQQSSIFEDDIFHMTDEANAEVRKELASPEVAEALSWIKTGGWYHCAYDGESCKCDGEVRYGAPHTSHWSVAKRVTSGAILCTKDIFGDPAPGAGKQCGCHRASFALTKNENSVSYLQESWIFMLRLLARLKLLPFTGDRRYHGIELWSARHGGVSGGTLERYWIEKYVVEQYSNIPHGACLEWGDPYYVSWLHGCTNIYENKYEAVKYGQKQPSVEGNIVYASIYDFPAVIGGANLQFNFLCATELFEHLEKPYEAASALYQILAPGGAVLFTAPQQAQYHQVPQDFLRYTKEGVKLIMETAGFCVPRQLMAGSGDFIFDVARNAGLQIQDFTIEELDEGYQRGYDSISDGAITIHAMAYKPPHVLCR